MRDAPPQDLVDLLVRLHLATPEQVRAVGKRVRRMAHDLPLFDSLWIDALVQAGLLNSFQAAELGAGRGPRLRVGPYVIRQSIGNLGYCQLSIATDTTEAVQRGKQRLAKNVHLLTAQGQSQTSVDSHCAALQSLAARFAELKPRGIAPLTAAGSENNILWAAFSVPSGYPASKYLACHGRLPPATVLEIARQMVVALDFLHTAGIAHGDIAASSLWLSEGGEVVLTRCGARGIIRPDELRDLDQMPLEALDYLAPQRCRGTKATSEAAHNEPSAASDLFACGCLWWQLLAGRPPILGGDIAAKMKAVSQAKIPNVRNIAPDVAEPLALAIDCCTQRDPQLRPSSVAKLAEQLGLPIRSTHRRIAANLSRYGQRRRWVVWQRSLQVAIERATQPLLAMGACIFLLAAATWPLWRPHMSQHKDRGINNSVAMQAESDRQLETPKDAKARIAVSAGAMPLELEQAVRQVGYQVSNGFAMKAIAAPAEGQTGTRIELMEGAEITAASIRLQPGAIVTGRGQRRPRILTPPNGLLVGVDQVRFENIDFIWRQKAEEITSPERHAVVDVRAPHAEFVNCTFQAISAGSFELPVAIRLSDGNSFRADSLAPAVRVHLQQCSLEGVVCGIDCRLRGPAAITLEQVLYLGQGSLIRFPQIRKADAPTAVSLDHVTVRGARSILELDCGDTIDPWGTISVSAAACVFAPEGNGGLVLLAGPGLQKSVKGLLRSLDWAGQGSLFSPNTAVAIWQHAGKNETLPEADFMLEGLVATAFDFAGLSTTDPATSRLQRWLAPQKTDEPPGIGAGLPALPNIIYP